MNRRRLIGLSVAVYAALASAGVGWAALAGRPAVWAHPAPWLTLDPWAAHAASLAAGAGLAAATVALTRLAARRTAWARRLHAGFRELLGDLDGTTVLALALCSGIGEEVFFRGGMQPSLGWVATSLIFGLIHVGPDRRFLAWTPWAVAMGFALGAIHAATGSLLGAILAHVWINHENLAFIVAWDPSGPDAGDRSAQPRLVGREERR